MSPASWFRLGCVPVCAVLALTLPPHREPVRTRTQAALLTCGFEKNAGQTNSSVRYLLRGRHYGVFVTPSEMVLSLGEEKSRSLVRLGFPDATPRPESAGIDPLPGRVNYLIG